MARSFADTRQYCRHSRQAFVSGWISCFGVPSTITTDRGQQFELSLWKHLMRLLGTQRIRTTAYNPIANGLIEHFYRQLKGAIKCLSDTTQWTKALPLILLGIHTTFKQYCRWTATELVYGTTLRLPDYFTSTPRSSQLEPHSYVTQLKTIIHKLQSPNISKQKQRTIHIHTDISSCPYAFVRYDGVRKSLQPPYNGPFKVLQRFSKHFTLDVAGQKKVFTGPP